MRGYHKTGKSRNVQRTTSFSYKLKNFGKFLKYKVFKLLSIKNNFTDNYDNLFASGKRSIMDRGVATEGVTKELDDFDANCNKGEALARKIKNLLLEIDPATNKLDEASIINKIINVLSKVNSNFEKNHISHILLRHEKSVSAMLLLLTEEQRDQLINSLKANKFNTLYKKEVKVFNEEIQKYKKNKSCKEYIEKFVETEARRIAKAIDFGNAESIEEGLEEFKSLAKEAKKHLENLTKKK